MKIDIRKESDVTIVKPVGRMDFNSLMEFSALMNQTIQAGAHKLLLDCSELEYLSSSGIRTMVDCQKQIQAQKGTMAFCMLNEQIKELFQVVQLDKLFKIYPTEFEALDKMMA
ncbi:MAG: STAS domain-containing protein [Candidatus Omnitrophica bacterium]|nr:STAS domain-containing protein [Candidatus Omnitrophota bacterium]